MAEVTLDDAPRKARELFDKGFAAMERGNYDYAIDILLGALEIEPRFLHARKYLRATEIKKLKGKKGSALTHMLSTIVGLPGVLSVSAKLKKKPDEALKAAEKLMRADCLNVTFMKLLGQAAVAAKMPEVAIQTLEVAKEYYPDDASVLQWLGNLYIDTDQPSKARECFDKLVELRPNDPQAIKMQKDAAALFTVQKGKWDTAESYRDVIKDTKEAALIEQEAKAVKTRKDLDALIENTKKKIQQEPENINYQRALADLYTRAELFDDALKTLRQAFEFTGRVDPQLDLAIRDVRVKQFDHEIAQLRAAGDNANADAKTKEKDDFLLADAQDRVKRYPNDLQFRYSLGMLLYEHGELKDAIQQFQLSQRNPQRRIRSLYYLAMCFEQKGQYDLAVEQLEKAGSEIHSMDDTKKDIFYALGTISEKTGDREKAAAYFKEIYAVDISYKDVAEKIDKYYK